MKEKLAEVKPFKLREPLTGNADGNPEPSLIIEEGAETRRRVCIRCSAPIIGKYKSAKYCSIRCRQAEISYRHRVKTGKIKNPGVGSGGNQLGKNNHQYKTGIGSYNKIAFNNLPNICNRCDNIENLLVHHIDHNRSNNELNNLEILCKRCHQLHHTKRDAQGKYTKG